MSIDEIDESELIDINDVDVRMDLPPKERVEGTIATTVLGIRDGVDIVRVHDVEKNLRAAKMADAIYRR